MADCVSRWGKRKTTQFRLILVWTITFYFSKTNSTDPRPFNHRNGNHNGCGSRAHVRQGAFLRIPMNAGFADCRLNKLQFCCMTTFPWGPKSECCFLAFIHKLPNCPIVWALGSLRMWIFSINQTSLHAWRS